jgi:sensor histidine kinase YesM
LKCPTFEVTKAKDILKQKPDITTNQIAISLLIGNRYRLARHLLLLVALLLFLYSAEETTSNTGAFKYGKLLCIYFGFIAMFYINMYLLVPFFFFKGRYLFYLTLLALTVYLVLLTISFFSRHYFQEMGAPPDNDPHRQEQLGLYTGSVICIAIILVTTTFKLFVRWVIDREKISEMNNLALNLELDGLRNQINPHFLFNMLNNVKALIRIDPEKASEVIMKLSEFLRYQLYDNRGSTASLQSELNFLFNLVELEKIRRDNLTINILVDIDPELISKITLPPNLFTNFIENAIKYSVDISGEQEEIKICLSQQNRILRFNCTNTRGPNIWNADTSRSGLGLSNTKRRLELLYRGNYFLKIESTPSSYTVDLNIPI